MIENGHKILFGNAPTNYSFEKRGSTNKSNDFVSESIWELLERGCIKEFSYPPEFCNHLHVAVQSSGKLRLILQSRSVIKIWELFFKFLTMEIMRSLALDLKSAYHHIDICK